MLGEIEDRLSVRVGHAQIDIGRYHLVFLGHSSRHDLAGWRDDGGAADHVSAVF